MAAAGGSSMMRLGESTETNASSASSDGVFESEKEAAAGAFRSRRNFKNRCMRELPSSLGPDELGQLALVTHLNVRELQTIDQLFCMLVEVAQAIGERVRFRTASSMVGTPRAGVRDSSAAGPVADKTWALNAKQLRRLPEFGQNVFLDRFIRIFSETGEDNLTLLELIDMYSALSRRASFDWKAWILFCVFDYDEDGMLDAGDIYRSIRQMIVQTHSMRVSQSRRGEAAVLVQKHFRGRQDRKKVSMMRAKDSRPPIRQLGRSPTFTEAYVRKILAKCQGVQREVMDFRYFEGVLRACPAFDDYFCITMCKPRKVERLLRGSMLQKLAQHDAQRFQRIEQFLESTESFEPADDWKKIRTVAKHATSVFTMDAIILEQQQAEKTVNPLSNEASASKTWSRNDALARKVKKLDKTVERYQKEIGLKTEQDDYDVARETGDGMWKPYGQMGAASGLGMRPPILATRLRWIGLDMRMLRMLSGKGVDSHLTVHVSDHMEYQSESVDQVLHEFSLRRNRSPLRNLLHAVLRTAEKLHHGLWGHALADISHKHGAGIMELAAIMKWMMLLNFALGMMWMVLVVVPRDLTVDAELYDSVVGVVSAMVFNGTDTERNLFYDGFERKQGLWEHMDFFYFTSIVATIIISLGAMLRKLGTIPLTGKAKVKQAAADAGMEWATILGGYDFTQVDQDSATKMRQNIRGKIEDWHADLKEALLLEELEHATWAQHAKHVLRMRSGTFMTNLLLIIYALAWFWMLNNESVLKDYHVLLAPAILAGLNVSSPPIIKFITVFERRAKSIDVMEACVKRIFRVKVVQLLTIYYTIFQIMSNAYADQLGTSANSTSGDLIDWDELIGSSPQNASSAAETYDDCPEARSGKIFLHQLIMDAVVFITIQYAFLFMVKVGFPNLLVWRSTVTRFGKGKGTEKNGYRLHLREGRVAQGEMKDRTAFANVFSQKKSANKKGKYTKALRWYMLQPHKKGRWYKQGVISILLEHFIHQVLSQGANDEEAKYKVLEEDLPTWRTAVKQFQQESRQAMLKADCRTLARTVTNLGLTRLGVSQTHSKDPDLKAEREKVEKQRHTLARAIKHKSEVFSMMDLDALSEMQLLDTGKRVEVEEGVRTDFQQTARRFKENAIYVIQEHGDSDPDPTAQVVSGLETTSDAFVGQIQAAFRKLAQHTAQLEQKDEGALGELLNARPRHRERRGCHCGSIKHKSSKATALRLKKRSGESAEEYKKRKNVHSLLKADVQHAPSTGTSIAPVAQSPLNELRGLLTAVPVQQLCLMVEAIRENELVASDSDEVLTQSISIDQAGAWRYHRFYMNQSIGVWLKGVTVPGYVEVEEDGNKRKKRVHKNINKETQEAMVAAFAKRDIHTVGEMLDHRMDDKELQHLIKSDDGSYLPTSIVRQLRSAQGEWADVTPAVEQKRWIRMPPTELKHDESASLIIGMLWRQVFVWAGTAFCPWLPLIACVLQVLMFTALQHCLLHGRYLPPRQPWAAGTTTELFMRFGMQTLLLCVLPITMWLNAKPKCGPHAGIQIASTYSLFETQVVMPWIDGEVRDGEFPQIAKALYSSFSFLVHYLMNSTFLLLIVFVMWTRGRTRQIQLTTANTTVNQLKKQSKLDAGYLQSRLREAKKQADKAMESKAIHLEQQKMHQYIMSQMGAEMKTSAQVGKQDKEEALATASANEAFSNVTTRVWPLSEDHGLAEVMHRKHMPIIWMMQDTSVPNYTQFTIRVNDEVVVRPKLQRNDLCGDVPGKDHVLVLDFEIPEGIMADADIPPRAEVVITAPDANCGTKMNMTINSSAVPAYEYSCTLIQSDTRTGVVELQDLNDDRNAPVNGISRGDLALEQQRWDVRVPVYREAADKSDKNGNAVSDHSVVEFQVEVRMCTVEDKDEPNNAEYEEENLEKLSHKHLLKKAAASAGVEVSEAEKDAKSPHATQALIKKLVEWEENREKVKIPTAIGRYQLGMMYHRYSHFVNLHDALSTCVHKKDHKKLPKTPIRHHEHMHLFGSGNRGHFYEERRKSLEAFMQELLNSDVVQAHRNPYVLGFLGMFKETGEDAEAGDPYLLHRGGHHWQEVHAIAQMGAEMHTKHASGKWLGPEPEPEPVAVAEADGEGEGEPEPEPEPEDDADSV